MYEHNLKIQEK
jgi:hypothetical protein